MLRWTGVKYIARLPDHDVVRDSWLRKKGDVPRATCLKYFSGERRDFPSMGVWSMECLLSAGHLAFFAFPQSFALSESVSVSSFRLFCSLACWQALYRPWLFEAISKALSLASLKGMASFFFCEVLPCCRIIPFISRNWSATSLFLLCISFVNWNCPMQAIIASLSFIVTSFQGWCHW